MTGCVDAAAVDGAGVAILRGDARIRDLLYATDAVAARIDELHFTLGEGPSLQAFAHGQAQLEVDIGDGSASAHWPAFAYEVLDELDVHGVFAFPLVIGGARLGVFELYRRRREPFTGHQLTICRAAAAALAQAVAIEFMSISARFAAPSGDLPRGPSRDVWADVHIAVGMLAVRLNVPVSDALLRLRARAYADSRSIFSLAYDIVHRGSTIGDNENS